MRKKDQPHDRYFKDLMQDLDLAKKFLTTYLDPDIQQAIDWLTLVPYDTSLIGAKGRQLYADVLYKARTNDGQADVFFMLNHERKPDELLALKIEEYVLGTVRKSIRQKQEKPAFIIAFTLYNGLQRPYPYPHRLLDYFDNKTLAKKVLLDSHRLIDLSAYSDQELASHGDLGTLELFMKHVDNPDPAQWLGADPKVVQQLEQHKHLERSLHYLVEAGYHEIEDLLTLLEELSSKLKEEMLTTRQQIERQAVRRASSRLKEEVLTTRQQIESQAVREASARLREEMLTTRQQIESQAVREASARLREEVLTTRQQIESQAVRRGRKEGISEGRKESVQEIPKNMLFNLQLGLDITQQATGLSREALEQLKSH